MFTMLFPTKIALINLLASLFKCKTFSAILDFSFTRFISFILLTERRAASEAEKKAESKINITIQK
jgi:hypothetical protein